MIRHCLLGVVLVLACALSGCVTYSAGVAPSTRPVSPDGYTVINSTTGTSWGMDLLMFIPLMQASTSEALDDALHNRGADTLVQVCVDNRSVHLLLFDLQRIKIEGLAVKQKS